MRYGYSRGGVRPLTRYNMSWAALRSSSPNAGISDTWLELGNQACQRCKDVGRSDAIMESVMIDFHGTFSCNKGYSLMPPSPSIRAFITQGCRHGLLAGFVFGSNYGALQILIPFDEQMLGALSLAFIVLLLAGLFGGAIGIGCGIPAGGLIGLIVGLLTHYIWQPLPHPVRYRQYVRAVALALAAVVALVMVTALRTVHAGNVLRVGAIVVSVVVSAWWGSTRLANWYSASEGTVQGAMQSR